eukprot:CAMPEP_0172877106 /NCGR_PEP_ID=MMETSP1075-20121228/106142_1 /TAXON_ID=2916 /ORGANISM="Ceratium fusus, Strain PA161109" /LENGTH=118 /DNA_ID=CAMNT_0013728595 /DNA_START=144 /DNA_END=501 /DNA_ORIENTATION=+
MAMLMALKNAAFPIARGSLPYPVAMGAMSVAVIAIVFAQGLVTATATAATDARSREGKAITIWVGQACGLRSLKVHIFEARAKILAMRPCFCIFLNHTCIVETINPPFCKAEATDVHA